MQSIHNLLYTRVQIPIMDVKQVDVICTKKLQTVIDADAEVLQVIADVVGLGLDAGVTAMNGISVL